MTTIRDVARLAGVSAGTVSNVLNRPAYVRKQTRDRVIEAITALGFVPSEEARQYRPGRVRTVGVALANLDNPFFVDVGLAVESRFRELGVGVLLCNSSYDREQESHNLDLLVQSRVQGIVIAPIDENSSRLDMLEDRGAPIIFVDRVANDRDSWSVAVDDLEGGRIGARHLIERGHRQIGFLGHPGPSEKTKNRFRGAREVISAAGGSLQLIEVENWTIEAGVAAARRLAEVPARERPSAVFCANDLLAFGLQQELLRLGFVIPADLAIMGYDDLVWAAAALVPLTTLRQPTRELGSIAADMLMQRLDNPAAHMPASHHIVLKPELVERQSV